MGEGAHFLDSYLPAISAESYAVERRVRFAPDCEYVRQLEWGNPIRDSFGRTGEWISIAMDADEDKRFSALLHSCAARSERKGKFLALSAHELRGHLVELHGGTVNASSEGPGPGSEFGARLPTRDSGSSGCVVRTHSSAIT
jgi:hypothetical protein